MSKRLEKAYQKLMKSKVVSTGPGSAAFPDIEARRARALGHWHRQKSKGLPTGKFGGWGRIGLQKRYLSAGRARAKKLGLKWTPLDPRLNSVVNENLAYQYYDPYRSGRSEDHPISKKWKALWKKRPYANVKG
jgi:hypothetical protein